MDWDTNAANGGFGTRKTWLPVANTHLPLAVNKQQNTEGSLLKFYQHLLHWRRKQSALINGDMHLLPAHPQVLAFVRESAEQKLLCAFNFSNEPLQWALCSEFAQACAVGDSAVSGAVIKQGVVHFEPWGGIFAAS